MLRPTGNNTQDQTKRGETNSNPLEFPETIQDSQALNNFIAFSYLQNLNTALIGMLPHLSDEFKNKKTFKDFNDQLDKYVGPGMVYNPSLSYGEIYTECMTKMLDIIVPISVVQNQLFETVQTQTHSPGKRTRYVQALKAIDNFIDQIYANDNNALFYAYKFAEKQQTESTEIISPEYRKALKKGAKGNQSFFSFFTSSKITPAGEEHSLRRATNTFGPNFQPQLRTNIPSVRVYAYKEGSSQPMELRFGTIVERISYNPRIIPFFIPWLKMKERRRWYKQLEQPASEQLPAKSPIQHVYFNYLAMDRHEKIGFDEGAKEVEFTHTLHQLEAQLGEKPNIAVITLPADHGLMDIALLTNKYPHLPNPIPMHEAFSIMLKTATGREDKNYKDTIYDFYISLRVKQLLYLRVGYNLPLEEQEALILKDLIQKSISKLGFQDKDYLTQSEFQALYFHFTKYELINYIIETLGPETINFTCKDAIDRGGISSLYYNLIKSIELSRLTGKEPMTKEEFFQGLHAAPTLVKGRGMNKHLERGWNAIITYIEGQYKSGNKDQLPEWLITMYQNYKEEKLPFEDFLLKQQGTQIQEDIAKSAKSIREQVLKIFQHSEKDYYLASLAQMFILSKPLTAEKLKTYTRSHDHKKPGPARLASLKSAIADRFVKGVKKVSDKNTSEMLAEIEALAAKALVDYRNVRAEDYPHDDLDIKLESVLQYVRKIKSSVENPELVKLSNSPKKK